jgi:hypothetical protein
MKFVMSKRFVVVTMSAVSMLAVAEAASAQVRVGGWSLRTNGQVAKDFQYTGSCPVELKFGWGLISPHKTTVAYSFQRSDGAHTSNQHENFMAQPNKSVPIYYDWRLGAKNPRFQNFNGWVELRIESPNAETKRVNFTLHCQ